MREGNRLNRTFKNSISIDTRVPNFAFEGEDLVRLMAGVKLLESYFPNAVLILCKVSHQAVQYVSNCSLSLLGYPSTFLKSITPVSFLQLIHPDDIKAVIMCFERMEEEKKRQSYLPEQYKFSFHYRLQKPDKNYQYIIDEKNAFLDESGTYIHFSLLMIAPQDTIFTQPHMNIYKKISSGFQKINDFFPRYASIEVTPTERQVIKHMELGLRTKEISDLMNISPYTVRNHRTNIFKKTKTRAAIELIAYAKKAGWI